MKQALATLILLFLLVPRSMYGQQLAGVPGYYVTNEDDTVRTVFWIPGYNHIFYQGFSVGILIAPMKEKNRLKRIKASILNNRKIEVITPEHVKLVILQLRNGGKIKIVSMNNILKTYRVYREDERIFDFRKPVIREEKILPDDTAHNKYFFVKLRIDNANLSLGEFETGKGKPNGDIVIKHNEKPLWLDGRNDRELIPYLNCPAILPIIDSAIREKKKIIEHYGYPGVVTVTDSTTHKIKFLYDPLACIVRRYNQLCP